MSHHYWTNMTDLRQYPETKKLPFTRERHQHLLLSCLPSVKDCPENASLLPFFGWMSCSLSFTLIKALSLTLDSSASVSFSPSPSAQPPLHLDRPPLARSHVTSLSPLRSALKIPAGVEALWEQGTAVSSSHRALCTYCKVWWCTIHWLGYLKLIKTKMHFFELVKYHTNS